MMEDRPLYAEEIEWVDSAQGRGWRHMDEIRREATTLVCRTVGYVVEETAEHVLVVPSVAGEGVTFQGFGDVAIPTVAIRSRERVRRETDGEAVVVRG